MSARLPIRTPRLEVVPLEDALDIALNEPSPPERTSLASEVSKIVTSTLARFSAEDRLILKLRFESEMTVSQIAIALKQTPQLLYRRLQRLYEALRAQLQKGGVHPEDLTALIGSDDVELSFGLRDSRKSPTYRRSRSR